MALTFALGLGLIVAIFAVVCLASLTGLGMIVGSCMFSTGLMMSLSGGSC